MKKNAKGNVMVVQNVNRTAVEIAIYESEKTMKAHQKEPRTETQAEIQLIPVGDSLKKMQDAVTDLEGKTIAEMNEQLAEKAVMEAIDKNPKVLQRTKFDRNEWS